MLCVRVRGKRASGKAVAEGAKETSDGDFGAGIREVQVANEMENRLGKLEGSYGDGTNRGALGRRVRVIVRCNRHTVMSARSRRE